MSTELAKYDAQLAAMAEQGASVEKVTGSRALSTSGGILKFDDNPMPGNRVAAIVVASTFENTYYTGRWTPGGTIESPVCYAYGDEEENMGPHPSMQKDLTYFAPQSMTCDTCPHNEWGSSQTGRGKACQQRRRLALIPAGMYQPNAQGGFDLHLFNDPAAVSQAELATLKVPVTSVKSWAKYVKMLNQEHQLPPLGVITQISLVADASTQFKVNFDMVDRVPSSFLDAVFPRIDEAKGAITRGYESPEADDPSRQQQQLRGLR